MIGSSYKKLLLRGGLGSLPERSGLVPSLEKEGELIRWRGGVAGRAGKDQVVASPF